MPTLYKNLICKVATKWNLENSQNETKNSYQNENHKNSYQNKFQKLGIVKIAIT